MSDSGVSVQVVSDDQISEGLKRIALKFQPRKLASVLDEIGASNVTETQHRFETETDPAGEKWADLSEERKEERRARGQTKLHILRDRVDLYDSITHKVHLAGVAVGTNRVYARIHQLGGEAGRGRKVRIPARPYLGVSAAGRKEILAIIADHVEDT